MVTKPGYTGKIARVDLSTGIITTIPTDNYSQDYLGGHGIAAKIYWDEVSPHIQAFDPENRLIFATGPCAGFDGLSGARWVVCGKSPAATPNFFTHCNLGGSWGVELKLAGFDGLIVQGKADKPVYLLVQDGDIRIREASSLWGNGAVQVRETLKGELGDSLKVVATGPAGDNMAVMATLLADNDSSGSGSLGAVMGAKKLKAIGVRGSSSVKPAYPDKLQELMNYITELKKGAPQTDSSSGTREDHCWGCVNECNRSIYETKDGRKGKFMCQSSNVYTEWAKKYYSQPDDVRFSANRLCDDYGLNTKSIASIISWLQRCYQAGILTERNTNLPLDKIGSLEFIQTLTRDIALRQGFGEILATGIHQAAATIGGQAIELSYDEITKAGERMTYLPKTFITTGLLYAVEVRQPIQQLHEVSRLALQWVQWADKNPEAKLSSDVFRAIGRRFWGSELAVDFSTYEGKALAAKKIQDRQLAKESLILCDNVHPILYVEHSAGHVGDPSLESKVYSAITGDDMTEEGLNWVGERIFNLQRAILVREGYGGRKGDTLPEASYTIPLESERLNPNCLLPGKNGEIISRKGATFDKKEFQKMLGEFYELRDWDKETGLQKKGKLEALKLHEVAQYLAAGGLAR